MYMELIQFGFRFYFNVDNIFRQDVFGEYSFDVVAFDEWCQKEHGYDISKTGQSLMEFVTEKWGKEACSFIEYLVGN